MSGGFSVNSYLNLTFSLFLIYYFTLKYITINQKQPGTTYHSYEIAAIANDNDPIDPQWTKSLSYSFFCTSPVRLLEGVCIRQTWTAALPGWHTQALNDTMILAHMHHHVHLVIIMDTLMREKNRAYAKIGQKNLMGTSVPENVYQRRPKST